MPVFAGKMTDSDCTGDVSEPFAMTRPWVAMIKGVKVSTLNKLKYMWLKELLVTQFILLNY
jgi:hypothetical protein